MPTLVEDVAGVIGGSVKQMEELTKTAALVTPQSVVRRQENENKIDKNNVVPLLYNEQSFLIDYIAWRAPVSRFNDPNLRLGSGENLDSLVNGGGRYLSNEEFLNNLCYSKSNFDKFFNIKPYEISNLVPNIRLLKQFYVDNKVYEEHEFVFKNYTDLAKLNNVLDKPFNSELGGIKKVSIGLNTGKSAVAGSMVSVQLELVFQSPQTIFETTLLPNRRPMSYSDLFSFSKKKGGDYFQIKLISGWSGNQAELSEIDFEQLQTVSLLQLLTYSIELNEDGLTVLKIDYIGSIESITYDSESSNLLKTSEETKKQIKALESEIETSKREQIQDPDGIFGLFGRINVESRTAEIKQLQLNSKIDSLYKMLGDVNLYVLDLNYEDIVLYRRILSSDITDEQLRGGLFNKEPRLIEGRGPDTGVVKEPGADEDKTNEALDARLTTELLEQKTVNFMFLEDLLESALSHCQKEVTEKYQQKLKILLGNFIVKPLMSKDSSEIPLGSLPVSYQLINKLLADKVLGKSNEIYTIGQFIDDIMSDIIGVSLQESLKLKREKVGYQNNFDVLTIPIYRQGTEYKVIGTNTDESWLFLYTTSKQLNNISTDYFTNMQNKVPHFFFAGMDRGIVKSIKFTDNSSKKFGQAIYDRGRGNNNNQDSSKTDGSIQPKFYKATIKTVGCPYFYMGQTVYIDTTIIGINSNEKGQNLLLGGAYTVVKVSHEISRDTYETTIETNFETNFDGVQSTVKKINESDAPSPSLVNEIRQIK